MAVISILRNNGNNITKARNGTLKNIKINDIDYHFANKSITENGTCVDAVNEPLIDMQISGKSVQGILPEEYQQLDYIENSSTQLIDTGIIPTINTSVDLIYQTDNTISSQYIAGSRYASNSTVNYAINGSSSTSVWDVRFTNQTIMSSLSRTADKTRVQLNLNNGNLEYVVTNLTTGDTDTKIATGITVNGGSNLYLFAYNEFNIHPKLKIYSCKIYEQGALIRDFIPCYTRADGIAGLYDSVNNKFYPNSHANGANFIFGNVIGTSVDTPVEIHSVGERTKNLIDIPIINGETSAVIDCYIDQTISFSCQEYPTLIARDDGTEVSIWRIAFKRLDGTVTYAVDSSLKGEGTRLTAVTPDNPIISIEYRGIYIREGAYKGIQIEYGREVTDYEPYGYKIPVTKWVGTTQETFNMYIGEPLRGFGTFTDVFDYKSNKTIRRIGKKLFDGTEEGWELYKIADSGVGVFKFTGLENVNTGEPQTESLMSHFTLTTITATADFQNSWYRFTGTTTSSSIYVSATQTTLEEFKTWLAENKPYILYPLAEPVEEDNYIRPTINLNDGSNEITIDTDLKPSNLSIDYWKQI